MRARRFQNPTTTDIGLPLERLVKMRYSSYVDFAGTSGVLETQVVSCGDIHDPDISGIGHQPLGYDQWTTFFGDYVVVRSRIEVTFMYNQAQSANTQPVVGIYRDNSSAAAASSWTTLLEQGRSVHAVLPPSMSTPVTKLTLDYDARRDFNLKDIKDNTDRIGGSFGASPTEMMYYVIWVQGRDQSTTSASAIVYTVDYDVIVSKPKELAAS
jgi:hypothetical protein